MGEYKEKMNYTTLGLAEKAKLINSSIRTVFPASTSSYTCILRYQSCPVDSGSNTLMKSIAQSSPEKSMSCLHAGCRCQAPLPGLVQHQQTLAPSNATNLTQVYSGTIENVEEKDETECLEVEFPDASNISPIPMDAQEVIWHGNEEICVLQGQSPFDGSKSSILMKNLTRGFRPEKSLLTCGDFPPGCGSHAQVEDLVREFIPDKSYDPSIKSSAMSHVFEWHRNKCHADNQGVGANEAGSHSQAEPQTSSKNRTDNDYHRKENFLCHYCGMANKSNRDADIGIQEAENLHGVQKSNIWNTSPSSSEPRSVYITGNERHELARERVITTLTLYRNIYNELYQEKKRAGNYSRRFSRIDFRAAKEVKKRAGYVHGSMRFIGDVPGVEVGDKFYRRMELAVVGLHRPPQNGIDYMGTLPDILATSVVASWDYADDLTNPDELVYLGQGGIFSREKKGEDQKLAGGNLALANSMKKNKPVRVIRKDNRAFIYDGLFVVDKCQEIRTTLGKLVFEFLMKRLPGQPEIFRRKI